MKGLKRVVETDVVSCSENTRTEKHNLSGMFLGIVVPKCFAYASGSPTEELALGPLCLCFLKFKLNNSCWQAKKCGGVPTMDRQKH